MSLRRSLTRLAFVAILLGSHGPLRAQDSVVDQYEELVNRIFPWPPKGPDPLVLTLRFEFNFAPGRESEMIIKFTEKGATVEQAQAGVRLGEVLETATDTDDTAALVKAARIEKRVKTYDAKAAQEWTRTFWIALEQSSKVIKRNVGSYQLDGATYGLRLDTGLTTVTLSIKDAIFEDQVTGDMPIVRWMNKLRLDFADKR